jgi:rubrerythrin
MSGTGIDEIYLADLENIETPDHAIRRLQLEIAIAKEKHAWRELEEMARQRKLKEMGYNPELDNDEFPAYSASDFSA